MRPTSCEETYPSACRTADRHLDTGDTWKTAAVAGWFLPSTSTSSFLCSISCFPSFLLSLLPSLSSCLLFSLSYFSPIPLLSSCPLFLPSVALISFFPSVLTAFLPLFLLPSPFDAPLLLSFPPCLISNFLFPILPPFSPFLPPSIQDFLPPLDLPLMTQVSSLCCFLFGTCRLASRFPHKLSVLLWGNNKHGSGGGDGLLTGCSRRFVTWAIRQKK